MGGDFFLGSVLAATLTKLVLKLFKHDMEAVTRNLVAAEVLLIMTSIVRLGQSHIPPNPIDADSYERIILCIKVLSEPTPLAEYNCVCCVY